MIRVLCVIGGLAGATGLSQFPEFSQQYLQRLGGQVDELTRTVKEFDAQALALGLGREESLQQLTGTPTAVAEQASKRRTFARHAVLSDNLTALREASPLQRLTMVHRMADPDTLTAVWADYEPAVPVSVAGVASAGTGFVGGWAVFAAFFAIMSTVLRRPGRGRSHAQPHRQPPVRVDPPVSSPVSLAGTHQYPPKLSGVRR